MGKTPAVDKEGEKELTCKIKVMEDGPEETVIVNLQ